MDVEIAYVSWWNAAQNLMPVVRIFIEDRHLHVA